ncbi:MAG: bifunctional diguanylate cyclase/phosphodiesterase [Thiovulaceae bacterium]|nr:bifunctional diguanylate cyclase/phosphodiesterase [Sulfurimonadaceae bacterium]
MHFKLYAKYIFLSLIVIMTIFILQVIFVLKIFSPIFLLMPIIASFIIGILLTRVSIKNTDIAVLKNKVYIDPLTNIPNRMALNKDITNEQVRALFLLDISNFSTLNDLYGEKVGDVILIELSSFLSSIEEENYKVYRYMGDRFAFLCSVEQDENGHLAQMVNLFEKIERHIIGVVIDEKSIELNISIIMGGATKNMTSSIMEKADMALNYAKREKNPTVIYSESLKIEEHYANDLEQIELVKKALKEDRIIPVYQPIVKNGTKSYECLVRIKDKDRLISPAEFLTAIKKTRYYAQLSKVMIAKSFKYFSQKPGVAFSINLSFEDIVNPEVYAYLFEMVEAYGLGERLIIEIVESESVENFKTVTSFIKAIRALGTRIAIDDFGSGYSNFSYLLQMEPDFIKIDGSIIKDIDVSSQSYKLTKLIHEASKSMNIETIAEYIHNEAVHKKALELGIDAFQGYYIGLPAEDVDKG